MKILLVNPLWTRSLILPLNLAELAGYLMANGYPDVLILDLNVALFSENNPYLFINKAVELILKSKPDVIGITCNTLHVPFCSELCQSLKRRTNIPIVLGGIHPTAMPESILRLTKADYVVRGEGEETFLELLNVLQEGKIPRTVRGCSFCLNEKIVHTPDRPLIENLDSLPIPAYHLLGSAIALSRKEKSDLAIPYLATRGCPFLCSFCSSSVFWKKQRRKSVEKVITELSLINEITDSDHFAFLDDCLTLNKKWFSELLVKITELKLKWSLSSRIDTTHPEIFDRMKNAGCVSIYHGIESGNERIRALLGKNFHTSVTNDSIVHLVRKEIQSGLTATCSFMTGIPTETEQEMDETYKLAKLLKDCGAKIQYWLMTPYPDIRAVNEFKSTIISLEKWKLLNQLKISYSEQLFLSQAFIDKKKYKKENPDFAMFKPDFGLRVFIKKYQTYHSSLVGSIEQGFTTGNYIRETPGKLFFISSGQRKGVLMKMESTHKGDLAYIILDSFKIQEIKNLIKDLPEVTQYFVSIRFSEDRVSIPEQRKILELHSILASKCDIVMYTRPLPTSLRKVMKPVKRTKIIIPSTCYDCMEMFKVTSSGQIEFCNGLKAFKINHTLNRYQIFQLFNSLSSDFTSPRKHCFLLAASRTLRYRATSMRRGQRYYDRGYVSILQRDFTQAIENLEIARRRGFNDWVIDYLLGHAHSMQKNYKKAIILFKKAEEKKPFEADINYQIAKCYKHVGNVEQLFKHITTAQLKEKAKQKRKNSPNIS